MKKTALENWICETEGVQTLSRRDIETMQLQKLNALLHRERERGGFYRSYPLRLESLEALQTLPFTTPEDLAAHSGAMLLTSQAEVSRVITGATSGTTGPAKRVFYTDRDIGHTVGFFAAGISELVFPGDRVMVAMPFSGPFGLGDLIARAVERLGAVPLRTGLGKSYGALCAELDAEEPAAYIGMPVPLLGLLRFYEAHLGRPASVRRALVSGDACPVGVVRQVGAILGTRLFPHYGSREMCLGGAVTCSAHAGMHLRENHIIAEIVDDNGAPVPEGTCGELVITTLDMEALPLLRYRTGDLTRFLPGPCPCGGVTRRLDSVFRRGPESRMAALDDAMFSVPGLVDFCAEQKDGAIWLQALTLQGADAEPLRQAAASAFPGQPVHITARACRHTDRPCYAGKRHVIRADAGRMT